MNKEIAGIKEIIAYEKAKMLPINFAMTYIVIPIYVVIALVLISAFAILMHNDVNQHLVHGMICLGALMIITIALFVTTILVHKKAIKAELRRYQFDTSKEEAREQYDFSTKDLNLVFDKSGLHVNNKLFYYNRLNNTLVIKNDCKRIDLYLRFALSDEHYLMLYLEPATLKMLECFEIQLDNQDKLNKILADPEKAFKQIYSGGAKV